MPVTQHKVSLWISDSLYVKLQAEMAKNKSQGMNLSDVIRQALVQVFEPVEPNEALAIPPVKVLALPSLQANAPSRDEKAALVNLQKW